MHVLRQLSSRVRLAAFKPVSSVRPFVPTRSFHACATLKNPVTEQTINPKVVNAEYAVRGELVIKALGYESKLNNGETLPFDEMVYCNIGNPQQLGQKAISFHRQVLSVVLCPSLLKDRPPFPSDVFERAERMLEQLGVGGTGAYTNSQGVDGFRQDVAKFIADRDGHPASADDIFLTDGASPAVQMGLNLLIRSPSDGIMIPIPQYPLYSAAIALFGGSQVGYFLDESNKWGLSVDELERSFSEAKSNGVTPRALAVINPGNPTGQCLEESDMREVVRFCLRNDVLLMADEVYQENIYNDSRPFKSFKAVMRDMGEEASNLALLSFHSTSKGFLGECGRRGGYVEMVNIDPDVKMQYYKLASVNLCSNVMGQAMMSLMVNPPKEGEPSYEQYEAERKEILSSLRERAAALAKWLNSLEGVTCNDPQGAMYAFPQIRLPAKAIEAANAAGKAPDTFYALAALDATGVVVVPGSGFGQVDGTYHFRTTFLPPADKITKVMDRMTVFHKEFMAKYA